MRRDSAYLSRIGALAVWGAQNPMNGAAEHRRPVRRRRHPRRLAQGGPRLGKEGPVRDPTALF